MKESRNVEGHRPVDIVNEKEDTEVKTKLLGIGSIAIFGTVLLSNSARSDVHDDSACTIRKRDWNRSVSDV